MKVCSIIIIIIIITIIIVIIIIVVIIIIELKPAAINSAMELIVRGHSLTFLCPALSFVCRGEKQAKIAKNYYKWSKNLFWATTKLFLF